MVIGRESEIIRMRALLESDKSEFLAVTGRRRIGKTYLIDNVYKKHISFSITGIQNGSYEEQLMNFWIKLNEYSKIPSLSPSSNWQEAFFQLKNYLKSLNKKSKKVLFFDELPWIYTQRSKFIQMLAHFWNDFLSKESDYILVVCGSATSWLTNKIINDPGGLHNRLTEIIKLSPFNLYETKIFLKSKKINLIDNEIAKIFMAFGGIPYYLEQIKRGENSLVAIERLCFEPGGILKNEYDNLYKSLFKNASVHEKIVETLAKSTSGLTGKEILAKSKLKANGTFNRALKELLQSEFVTERNQFGRKKKDSIYMLNDEYSNFYIRFIKPNTKYHKGIWSQLAMSQTYKIWSGYAFETVCFKHIDQIKNALGILGVYTEISTIKTTIKDSKKVFQIDLIIDRKDDVINLCEIKFHSTKFKINKKYAEEMFERKQNFIDFTKTKKQVFITFITNNGVEKNSYFYEVINSEVVLNDLMKKL